MWLIPDLEAKMIFLREAIAAFLPDPRRLRPGVIAKALGLGDSEWSKMRKGERPVSPETLSGLCKHINYGIEPNIFRLPLVEFQQWFRDNGKGNYGKVRRDRPIWDLGSRARPKSATETFDIVSIENRSGLGTQADLTESSPVLKIGAHARIDVSMPKGGCFLLLNEQREDGEVTSIVPSPLFPSASQPVDAVIRIPRNGPMRVTGPAGHYCLYAIWMAVPLDPAYLATLQEGESSHNGTGKLSRLTREQVLIVIAHLQQHAEARNRVLTAEYRVVG